MLCVKIVDASDYTHQHIVFHSLEMQARMRLFMLSLEHEIFIICISANALIFVFNTSVVVPCRPSSGVCCQVTFREFQTKPFS